VNKAAAFLVRDFQIHHSYRLAFFMEAISAVLTVVPYYFLAHFVGLPAGAQVPQYGGDYFSFILVGVVVQQYLLAPLYLFTRHIRESQLNGTLEAVLSTQTPLHTVIVSSALYPLLWSTIHVFFYLWFARAILHFSFAHVNWIAAILILSFAVIVSGAIGILSASFILVFKRADPFTWLMTGMSTIFAGVLYPVTVLPVRLRVFSDLLPLRYAIEGMRGAMLQNRSLVECWASLRPLIIFAVVLLPLSLLIFHYVNRHVRITGTIADY
jgi:ABC-2 type transport system permease protein